MAKIIKVGFIAAALFAGCSSLSDQGNAVLSVDGTARADASNYQTYFLIPSLEGVADDPMLSAEFCDHLESALTQHGLRRVIEKDRAGLVVFAKFIVGAPKEKRINPHHSIVAYPTAISLCAMEASKIRDSDRENFDQIVAEGMVWKTLISNAGKQRDLRPVIREMILQAAPFISTDTKHEIRLRGD